MKPIVFWKRAFDSRRVFLSAEGKTYLKKKKKIENRKRKSLEPSHHVETVNFTVVAPFAASPFDLTSKAKDQRLGVWRGEVPGS